ncbi:hypothetical protein ACINWC323_0111 [Acinetobacter sp. WC-323]|uniref:hypothetical protein n=1 Tax=Acinetobacter sp. WC-323 TaxID=903918 RepID=UPI00029E9E9D|nr:hypothetical protein [Acinetobacter sp. WC-323]EKU57192.1 hypothetical protein ACINWC323_0111 [Acinetobacter sp. WC-323]
MEKSEIINNKFNRLVENAFDFLQQSIAELENRPKFSVIHFHASIELFLKARLMDEHWSLVIAYNKEPDWNKFQNGDFVSVNLDEASKKLSKVVQSGLSDKALAAFHNITRHRNQMVHFYHEADTLEKRKQEIQKVVKEQLRAWYFLNDLLSKQWKDTFNDYSKKIYEISFKLKKQHLFLQVKYEEIKPRIVDLTADGYKFDICPSCDFESNKHSNVINETYESECLVCDLRQFCLIIKCDKCFEGDVLFQGEPHAKCNKCKYSFDGDELKEKFIDDSAAYIAIKDGIGDYFPINCGTCSGYGTVVEINENDLLCVECFDVSRSYGTCEWCNEQSTNLREDSYLTGCEFCEGRMGWERDD